MACRMMPAPQIREQLGELTNDGLLTSTSTEEILGLWLPHSGGRGISIHEWAPSESIATTLEHVEVPALALSAVDAVDLLSSLVEPRITSLSDSFRYWSVLARFVLSLLDRKQFVPELRETPDGGFEARWRPVVLELSELHDLERLAQAMPPVCRAFTMAAEAAERRDTNAVDLVDSFLAETTHALIRRNLASSDAFDHIHERARHEPDWQIAWLSALLSDDPTVPGNSDELREASSQIRLWLGQLEPDADDAPPKLVFALEAPADGVDETKAAWQVHIELRSAADGRPLDIGRVWSEPEDQPIIIGRQLVNRRQHLMLELRRAAQSFPELQDLLDVRAPHGIDLTTTQAYTFLRERVPLLESQGFEVILPPWARMRDSIVGIRLHVQPSDIANPGGGSRSSTSLMGLNSVVDFNWQIAVGDQHISLDQFREIASRGVPLVRAGDRWVGLDGHAAQRTLDYIGKRPSGQMTLAEVLRLASGLEDTRTGLPSVGLTADDWLQRFLADQDRACVDDMGQPRGFAGELRPYQLRGLQWLAFLDRLGIGSCLADDMGLGKTIQLIALLLHEREVGTDVGPTLLFAPMSVVGNWLREVQRFAKSLRVMAHRGPERLAGARFAEAAMRHDLVVTTYGLAQRDLNDLARVPWHRITLDEAQKIKNPSAHQTIAIRSLQSPRRVALTGTPLENHLSELWSILEMLNPGLLGTAAEFRRKFVVPISKLRDKHRTDQLRRLIRPFVLRRLKSDPQVACDLPDKIEMRVYCNLTAEQAAYYERTVQDMLTQIDQASGIRRRGLILATLTRLKQVCNHPAQLLGQKEPLDGRSGKCERLVEMLEEALDEGDSALVFTQYREMGDLLNRILKQRLQTDLLFMHGGSSAKKRDEMIEQFQDPAGPHRVFILSLKTGGFGLNLTRANHVFHFDRWWNPAVEAQATDRAHRIGQTRQVQVHKFVCIGTIEERIDQMLLDKAALAEQIVGSGDDWVTSMSTRELREYLSLSRDAVGEE